MKRIQLPASWNVWKSVPRRLGSSADGKTGDSLLTGSQASLSALSIWVDWTRGLHSLHQAMGDNQIFIGNLDPENFIRFSSFSFDLSSTYPIRGFTALFSVGTLGGSLGTGLKWTSGFPRCPSPGLGVFPELRLTQYGTPSGWAAWEAQKAACQCGWRCGLMYWTPHSNPIFSHALPLQEAQ